MNEEDVKVCGYFDSSWPTSRCAFDADHVTKPLHDWHVMHPYNCGCARCVHLNSLWFAS